MYASTTGGRAAIQETLAVALAATGAGVDGGEH